MNASRVYTVHNGVDNNRVDKDLSVFAMSDVVDDNLKSNNRFNRIVITILKLLFLLLLLYLFVCSLDLMGSAFRLVGSRAVAHIIADSELLKNPVVGLMIGVLVTVLVQSSSTSTSIVVTMVGSDIISVRQAIPIVMGANIGTSVTNTIVSLMQSTDRNEFRLAFAAATVHDMFNWLTVIVLLPIEVTLHYLESITDLMIAQHWTVGNTTTRHEFLGRITKPFTKTIIELDKTVLNRMASGEANVTEPLIKRGNSAIAKLYLDDTISGLILLVVSLLVLCFCLVVMVKVLHSLLKGQIALVIKKTMNKDYPFPYSTIVNYMAILIGCLMTILVQSSSIFTSALTPLAGLGIISLERMYPLTLGSNVGTTTTGILAALAADPRSLKNTLQLAFCHMFFNITGILLFYPIPFMRFPIQMARTLGNITAKYRWFSVFYLIAMFFVLPTLVFGLSLANSWLLMAIGGPIVVLFVVIIIINVIQHKFPKVLPKFLRNWDFLPLWMHSLKPIDNVITSCLSKCSCCKCAVHGEDK